MFRHNANKYFIPSLNQQMAMDQSLISGRSVTMQACLCP